MKWTDGEKLPLTAQAAKAAQSPATVPAILSACTTVLLLIFSVATWHVAERDGPSTLRERVDDAPLSSTKHISAIADSILAPQINKPTTESHTTEPTEGQATQPTTEGQATQPTTQGQAIQPTTEGQATQPTTEGQATQPTTQGQAIQPTTEGQATQPTTDWQSIWRVTQLTPEGHAIQPTTDGQASQPTTESQAIQPTTEGQAIQPTVESQATQPTTDGQAIQPTTDGQATQPTTDGQAIQPTVVSQATQPTTDGQAIQPTTDGQATQPTTDGQATQPTTDGQATQPTIDGQATQPTTDGQATQPTTDGQATQPTTDGQATQPTTESQATQPTTDGQAIQPTIETQAKKPTVQELAAQVNWPHAGPPYIRGKDNYLFFSSTAQREDGYVLGGNNARLRHVMHRMLAGEPIRITAVGASITAGHCQIDGLPWPQYVFNYMSDHYGPQVQGTNGAVPGTRTSYMAVCSEQHVPQDSDIIIVEYAVNDGPVSSLSGELKRSEERLVRKLLGYPKKPAVMFAHTQSWLKKGMENYVDTAEPALNELALYYKLPVVSIRACCFQDLLASTPGFNTSETRYHGQAGVAFYDDPIHMDGLTGARVLAELVIHAFDQTLQGLKTRPLDGTDETAAVRALPEPLFPNNYESVSDRCFVGDSLQKIVTFKDKDWEWLEEKKNNRSRFGMVSNVTMAVIKFKIDTTASSLAPEANVAVLVAYLKSYDQMGMAQLSCASGCTCEPLTIDGITADRNSQTALGKMAVTQSQECEIMVRVDRQTSSAGAHKVKITGIIVSEEQNTQGYWDSIPFFGDKNKVMDENMDNQQDGGRRLVEQHRRVTHRWGWW